MGLGSTGGGWGCMVMGCFSRSAGGWGLGVQKVGGAGGVVPGCGVQQVMNRSGQQLKIFACLCLI